MIDPPSESLSPEQLAAHQVACDKLLAAASAASAVTLHLIEAGRFHAADAGDAFEVQETAEHLAEALRTVLAAQLECGDLAADRREALGQLAAAVSRFLEGWA